MGRCRAIGGKPPFDAGTGERRRPGRVQDAGGSTISQRISEARTAATTISVSIAAIMIVLLVRSTLKEAAAPTRNGFLDAWEGLRRAVRLALLVTGNAVWDLLLQANLLLFHAVARPANFRARRARRAGHPKAGRKVSGRPDSVFP